MTDTVQKRGTPEGVAFELHPAGPVPRFLALLLDVLLGFVGVFVFAIVAVALHFNGVWLFYLVYFLVQTFGMALCELYWQGATPGKRALGLQVVMSDGRPVSVQASLLRNLLRFPDQLFVLGWVLPLVTPGFRRLGDLVAGTLVVYRRDLQVRLHTWASDQTKPQPAHRPLDAEAAWAVVEFGRRWDEFGAGLRRELAREAGDFYRRDTDPAAPEKSLRAVALWYGGQR